MKVHLRDFIKLYKGENHNNPFISINERAYLSATSELHKISGVYKISFRGGKFFIGKSNDIQRRLFEIIRQSLPNNYYYAPDRSKLEDRMLSALYKLSIINIEIISTFESDLHSLIKSLANDKMLNRTSNKYFK